MIKIMGGNFKVGLVLGGGGVRGMAHIGALQVLKEKRIPVSLIVGTSMGALIGTAYALNDDIRRLKRIALSAADRDKVKELEMFAEDSAVQEKRLIVERLAALAKNLLLWNLRVIKKQLVDEKQIEEIIKKFVGDKTFADLRIPTACIACDLKTGEEVVLNQGKIATAVLASCSMPGVFPPVKWKGRQLVDGGVVGSVSVEMARKLGADCVIAVNVEKNELPGQEFEYGIDVLFRADEIKTRLLTFKELHSADVVITPEMGGLSWANFSHAAECIRAGEKAMRANIDLVRRTIGRRRRRKWLRSSFFFRNKA